MDFVNEQDIPGLQVRQDCSQVAGALDHRSRCGSKADTQFAGDDLRQRGLTESGRPVQQHMVQGFAAVARGLDEHCQVFPAGLLANELRQGLRAQRRFGGVVFPAHR
jgi:hypothetical protein